jgi:hypothetical protein
MTAFDRPWWDLPLSTAPTDSGARIEPGDYFDWPICRREIGLQPKPSETLRQFPGARLVRALVDRLGKPACYTAALIGPKP